MAAVGLEPAPPERLVSKTSALDHSATLPNYGAMRAPFVVGDRKAADMRVAKARPRRTNSSELVGSAWYSSFILRIGSILWSHMSCFVAICNRRSLNYLTRRK